MHAEHRRQVNQARCECPEQNRHQDGEHNGTGSKPIEDDAARLKTRKKRRADLQADEENEKYQTEVAQEG
ncbi:unknown [Sutterella wadsworthensis CAG:135]|nr:unknown [Sutterella wadsworthensis CAG:135]